MKICKSCGTKIVNGKNGCMLSDFCFSCKPIYYPPVNRNFPALSVIVPDYENAILERQENND